MVIDVSDVSKVYSEETTALDNFSVQIDSGEFYGLLGQNGAGKTTLIGILTGQIKPDSGTVEVLGLNPEEQGQQVRGEVGIIPEQEKPPSFLTAQEYFEFIGDVRSIKDERLTEQIEYWSQNLNFENKLDILCSNLSRGQQQKVMVTAAFLHEPSLIFIDEPLANLDPVVQEIVKDELIKYHENGNTIVLSTHYTEAAAELCSKIGIISNGTLKMERELTSTVDSSVLTQQIVDEMRSGENE